MISERTNKSKIYSNGKVFTNNKGDSFTIIGLSEKKKGSRNCYVVIKFEDGTICEADTNNIRIKKVKNPNKPTIYGVGYLGLMNRKLKSKKNYKRTYDMWLSMLNRCYNKELHKIRPTYKDCFVNSRWHCFSTFYYDIMHIDGYNLWINNNIKMSLDKDIKISNNKEYSKYTCLFVTASENSKNTVSSRHSYLGIYNATGYRETFTNISDFSKKHNLTRPTVSQCMRGVFSQTKGWSFVKYY